MLSQELRSSINEKLNQLLGSSVSILGSQPVHGGSINHAVHIDTSHGSFFIKYNNRLHYPKMFELEASGLKALSTTSTINTPQVLATGETDSNAYLLIKYIQPGIPSDLSFEEAGRQLAALHRSTQDAFGFKEYNYIGSLVQSNQKHKTWSAFFQHERLEPLVKMGIDSGKLEKGILSNFNKLFKALPEIFPEEEPSLLHGDLWSGNLMFDGKGAPFYIDPAIYYGNREMDISMTKLFGGFTTKFYESYHETNPLTEGWQDRVNICNLYPLLVHVNIFGGSYTRQVWEIVKAF